MAKGKTPPGEGRPEHLPDQPPAEEITSGGDPRVREYEPRRNRSLPALAVLLTILLVVVFAVFYFLTRGN